MKNTLFIIAILLLLAMNIAYAAETDATQKTTSATDTHDHATNDDKHGQGAGSSTDHTETEEKHAHSSGDSDDHSDDKKEHEHENEAHGAEDEGGHSEAASDAELNKAQQNIAGITTMVVVSESMGVPIFAPGEVTLNKYLTSKVTPRISAQIIERFVRLGDSVTTALPLVTLSSVEMAQAQGNLLQASTEWRRVKKLGRKVVSQKRFINSEIAYQQAYAKVKAYGMTDSQLKQFLKSRDATRATGKFTLLSPQDGTIINDKFIVGEFIEPGRNLFEISDESLLWVEARLSPESAANVVIGAKAQVKVGKTWVMGKVTQARHTLDEITRTLAIHIEVANPNDSLHPGQFVSVVIEGKNKQQGIVVPITAVLRAADGDWQVFQEVSAGRFEPKEVDVIATAGNKVLITGISAGSTIVKTGAFFVQSEIAKSGFEVHNH